MVLAAAVLLQVSPSAAQDNPGSTVSTENGQDDVPAQATAEDILDALRKARPISELVPSANQLSSGGATEDVLLIAEGTRTVSVAGSLVRRGAWWVFQFNEAGVSGLTKLLPNAVLEGMSRSSQGSTKPIEFLLSGEYTVFLNENYLVPRFATRSTARVLKSSIVTPTQNAVAADAPMEDVLGVLQQQAPDRKIVAGAAPDQRVDDNLRTGGPLLPDGAAIVRRPGRLVRDRDWWTFAFESDNEEKPELPMKLFPCRNLELMVEAAEGVTGGLVFIVSGEVSAFYGENYILVRSVMRRIDTGNLTK